jgi:hypothetical protein
MLTRSIGVAVLTVLGLASSVAAQRPEPFAQASLQQALDCTPPGIPPYADTGLSVSFETKTDAVLISVTLVAEFPTNSGFLLRPTIDGVGSNSDPQVAYLSGTLDSHRTTVSFSRAYAATSGAHTYGLEWGCSGRPHIVEGWITVVPIR